jgi:hypothetical protein
MHLDLIALDRAAEQARPLQQRLPALPATPHESGQDFAA